MTYDATVDDYSKLILSINQNSLSLLVFCLSLIFNHVYKTNYGQRNDVTYVCLT